MKVTGLHLLLTHRCTSQCDHCFVWGSPRQRGTMTIKDIRAIVKQARETGTVRTIYFEGGEPFLYYETLLAGVREAARRGFATGIVTNAFWAATPGLALERLRPFSGLLNDLTLSSDLFHWSVPVSDQSKNALQAAEALGIATGVISIARPAGGGYEPSGQLPYGEGKVMYRGRAAARLASMVPLHSWDTYQTCPHEDLREPGRLHVDPQGNLHICQGLIIGNLFQEPLKHIASHYHPEQHPICGPLLRGGPAALVTEFQLPRADSFADACHLCYTAREALRGRFPEFLGPGQMYGE